MLGSNLGNMIALPRGDTPLFLIQWFASIFVVLAVLLVVKVLVGPVGKAFPSLAILPPGFSGRAVSSSATDVCEEFVECSREAEPAASMDSSIPAVGV